MANQTMVAKDFQSMVQSEPVKKRFTEILGKNAAAFMSTLLTVYNSNSQLQKCTAKAIYEGEIQSFDFLTDKPIIGEKISDEIATPELAQFLWDMQYWLNSSTLPLEELVIKIGLYYYTSDIEKSNVYLIAILAKRLNSSQDFDLTIQRMEELAKKPSLSGFKFFSEEDDTKAMRGKVQIMTLHKSKGDEFEYVFLPEMTEKAMSINVEKSKLKSSTLFMEEVKSFNPEYKRKNELEIKEFNSEESLRLLYVAITRAQKKLYITTHARTKAFGKETECEPCVIFGNLI